MDTIYEAYEESCKPSEKIDEAKIVIDPDDDMLAAQISSYLENNFEQYVKKQKAYLKQVLSAAKSAGYSSSDISNARDDASESLDDFDYIDVVWPT